MVSIADWGSGSRTVASGVVPRACGLIADDEPTCPVCRPLGGKVFGTDEFEGLPNTLIAGAPRIQPNRIATIGTNEYLLSGRDLPPRDRRANIGILMDTMGNNSSQRARLLSCLCEKLGRLHMKTIVPCSVLVVLMFVWSGCEESSDNSKQSIDINFATNKDDKIGDYTESEREAFADLILEELADAYQKYSCLTSAAKSVIYDNTPNHFSLEGEDFCASCQDSEYPLYGSDACASCTFDKSMSVELEDSCKEKYAECMEDKIGDEDFGSPFMPDQEWAEECPNITIGQVESCFEQLYVVLAEASQKSCIGVTTENWSEWSLPMTNVAADHPEACLEIMQKCNSVDEVNY